MQNWRMSKYAFVVAKLRPELNCEEMITGKSEMITDKREKTDDGKNGNKNMARKPKNQKKISENLKTN